MQLMRFGKYMVEYLQNGKIFSCLKGEVLYGGRRYIVEVEKFDVGY